MRQLLRKARLSYRKSCGTRQAGRHPRLPLSKYVKNEFVGMARLAVSVSTWKGNMVIRVESVVILLETLSLIRRSEI